jgi:hypothetical protein
MENIMKKRYLIFSALILSVLVSCMDLTENPKASLTPGSYFNTPTEVNGVIAAMYRQLAKDGSWGFTSGFFPYFGGDDLACHPASNKADQRSFDELNGDSGNGTNGGIGPMWNATWSGIYQANAIIANIGKVAYPTEDARKADVGQAYFIRALAYFYATKTFGDVPIVIAIADADARPARSPILDVYTKVILPDLALAETYLPASWPGEPAKATKWAAKALLANVYMNMAGWPLNQADKYALAASKANEVIQGGKFTLVPNYGDVFKTNFNSEAVFSLAYNTAGGLPRRSTGQFCIPDDETSEQGQAGWDDYCTEINFLKHAPACQRTDETFLTKIKKRGTQNADGTYNYTIIDWNDPNSETQHPYFKKFRYGVAAPGTTVGDGCVETPTRLISMSPSTDKTLDLIRYPMVLLNFAEATAMSSAPNADAYSAVNLVRKRAGLPDLTPGLGQIAFRDSVVFERAYECAGEFGVRWFDIQRLQLLPKVIAARLVGSYPADKAKGWENPLNPRVFTDAAFLQSRYLAPIPIDEMNRNPQWTQNAFY